MRARDVKTLEVVGLEPLGAVEQKRTNGGTTRAAAIGQAVGEYIAHHRHHHRRRRPLAGGSG